jgi:hypothetical protein
LFRDALVPHFVHFVLRERFRQNGIMIMIDLKLFSSLANVRPSGGAGEMRHFRAAGCLSKS